MQNVQKDNRALMSNSTKWASFVVCMKLVCDYIGDYLSGQKYKFISQLTQEKQK